MDITRRTFSGAALGAAAARPAPTRPSLCIFSKHMAKLDYEQLGKTAKQMGFEGVDLTVRPQGHVLPERAAEDLPRCVEVLRGHGLTVPMVTTALVSASDPAARPILSTAGRLKVPHFKLGYWRYPKTEEPEKTLASVKRAVRELVELGREYGIEAGFHNHSGEYVGMAVWDTRDIISGMDPRWIGYYYDPGHATVEGGAGGWQISLRMVLPRLKMVAVKDFHWEKKEGKWRARWCPLGEGMVDWAKVFSALAAARFTGPLSLHVEYDPPDEMAAIARDLEFLKKQVRAAYGA